MNDKDTPAMRGTDRRRPRAFTPAARGARLTGALLLTLGTLALGATSASAAETHLFEEGFGPDGTSATAFDQPVAVGVDQSTGAVYVVDYAAGTVQKFNAAHEPEAFNPLAPNVNIEGKLTGFSFISPQAIQVAVNPVSHDLYLANNSQGNRSIDAYQSDGKPADFTLGPGAGTNEIGGEETCGVAVDSNGDIYEGNFFNIQVYAPSGEHLTTIPQTGCSIAVDSHGALYVNQFSGAVEKLTPSEFPVTSSTSYSLDGTVDANASFGVAVDPTTNDLYVDEHTQIAQYGERLGVFKRLGSFGTAEPGALTASDGLAVNAASGQVYVSDTEGEHQVEVFGPAVTVPDVTTGAVSQVGPMSATLNGTVNPDGLAVSDCHFDYGTSTTYGKSAPCEQAAGSGTGEVAVTAKITGLAIGTTYHYQLQASNTNGTTLGNDATLSTPPPPAIDGATATNVAAESADLNAEIDPGSTSPSSETKYRFEYGTSTSYGTSVPEPEGTIAPGVVDVAVTQHIERLAPNEHLEPNRTYHWRVVATNASGTTYGADHTFIYDESGSGVLPDNRAYEMVTPPQKDGALIGLVPLGAPAAVGGDGSSLMLGTLQCFGDAGSCIPVRGGTGSLDSFNRTSTGWVATATAPPATQFETNSLWLYNPDAGTVLYSVPTPPHGEDDFYGRQPRGSFEDVGPLTDPEQGSFGTEPLHFRQKSAATADLSHVVWEETSDAGLFWPFPELSEGSEGKTTFEYTHAGSTAPVLVGVSGGEESTSLISGCGTAIGSTMPGGHSGLSADGRTVFFTAETGEETTCRQSAPPVAEVYARVDGGEEGAHTVAISQPDAPQTIGGNPPDSACSEAECQKDITEQANWRGANFVGSSANGSRVFFESPQRLTNDASEDPRYVAGQPTKSDTAAEDKCQDTAGLNGCNLYEGELDEEADTGKTVLKRLTAVSAGDTSGNGPQVQGVMAISGDGSHVYFVANGVLAPGAKPGNCKAVGEAYLPGGECNLYVYERDATYPNGHVTFIARLPASDNEQPGFQETEWSMPNVANVTPDGRFLVFTSRGALTADATPGEGPSQVYRYDAGSGSHPPTLVRVSIGERGFNDNGNGGVAGAKIVPAAAGHKLRAGVARTDPTMSDNGEYVFFMSPVALTTGALNGVQITTNPVTGEPEYAQNVYEYHDGQVSLISDGRDTSQLRSEYCDDASAVCLLGSDTSGANVFFTTTDQLVPQDTDTQLDVYDARIDGGFPPPSALPPCLGETCHGTPAATPSLLTPGSATFNGQGNVAPASPPAVKKAKPLTRAQKLAAALKQCRRDKKRTKRISCEKAAKEKYAPVKSKKKQKKK